LAYEVRIAPAANRAIGKLPVATQDAVLALLEELADNPRPRDAEKIKALPTHYKVYRVPLDTVDSSFRVIYQVKDSETWILVLKVADRKEVYERVSDLKRLLR
jgi:mRNA-degrading endonuclease RelE of RelBE toxin-antitoxin system